MRSELVVPLSTSGWSATVRTSASAASGCDMIPPWHRPALRGRDGAPHCTPSGAGPVPVMMVPNPRRFAEVRHPAAVALGQGVGEDHGSALAFMSRGPEHRVAALTLA